MGRSRMFDDDDPSAQGSSPRTTIVGGRPPDARGATPPVPTGIQTMLRLASVDPDFGERLVGTRAAMADAAGVVLTATEQAILAAIPAAQLREMIAHVPAPAPQRRDFLRQAAATAVILLGGAALAEGTSSCKENAPPRPSHNPMTAEGGAAPDEPPPRPDRNPIAPGGARPDDEPLPKPPPSPPPQPQPPPTQHPVTRGISPDMPPPRPEQSGTPQLIGATGDMPEKPNDDKQ